MPYFDRIDLSEDIHVTKTSASKVCITCHYWYFLDKRFKFQPDVWKSCCGILMMSNNLNGITILNIWGVDYHSIINRISKSEPINLSKNKIKIN